MRRLEEIFKIEDEHKRQKMLVKYAKSLKINVFKAKKLNGEYSENELAVLIYNTEQSNKLAKSQMLGILIAGLLVLLAGVAAILLDTWLPWRSLLHPRESRERVQGVRQTFWSSNNTKAP